MNHIPILTLHKLFDVVAVNSVEMVTFFSMRNIQSIAVCCSKCSISQVNANEINLLIE
jgi:hypothetical protein